MQISAAIVGVVLLLVHTVVDGQSCDGNIAQALQQCATSIAGGDSLAMQRANCGCYYAYPSTEDIDNLKQQYNDLLSMMQELKVAVANNTADIGSVIEHIEHPCGSAGWTRIAYLDMSQPGSVCPDEFMLYNSSGKAACGRPTSNVPSCSSITFPVADDLSYSSVCGKVLGYQKGTPQAINTGQGHNDLNSYYVDGVSITYGKAPNRQHVWTFMAAYREDGAGVWTCPCYIGSVIQSVQAFIGDDYFCEAGNSIGDPVASVLYTDDPLWDGENCRIKESPCCQVPGIPWFTKTLSTTTTEDVELRICGDEGTNNEDNPIFFYEIYVK